MSKHHDYLLPGKKRVEPSWIFLFWKKSFQAALLFSWVFFCYHVFSDLKKKQFDLQKQIESVDFQKKETEKQIFRLKEQLQSQHDPAWIELVLMEQLGMVPEGMTKIVFQEEEDND